MHVMEALATHNLVTTPWLQLNTGSTGKG